MGEIDPLRRATLRVAYALACALITCLTLQVLPTKLKARASGTEAISGAARIIDGDTIEIKGERIRLNGIDAPETSQSCPSRWLGTWRCGDAAGRQLRKIIQMRTVTCEGHERDSYGRLIGTCFVEGLDINAEMVRAGYAWAFTKYSDVYVGEQREAEAAKVGIWVADKPVKPAWDYRNQRWQSAQQTAPAGCAIKGNISHAGRIYHLPWSPWYDRVSINTARGERWFCDEAEAVAAGWRAARSG